MQVDQPQINVGGAKPLPSTWQLLFGPIAATTCYLLYIIGFPPLFLIWFLSVVGVVYLHKDEMSLELCFNWLSRFIVHIFFREYDSRNTHKIPPSGPVIFICNHNNQFLDPAVVQEFSPRPISWLIAAKSYRDPTIGKFARAQRAIPVERPQDLAKPGPGKLYHTNENDLYTLTAIGDDDKVDFIRDYTGQNATNSLAVHGETYRIAEVIDRVTIRLKASAEHHPPPFTTKEKPAGYKILPHVDQHVMFKAVWDNLVAGNCVGIFPEGGSHDNTTMLPLKAGVAIMALGSCVKMLEKWEENYGKKIETIEQCPEKFQSVSLIAVGLNYFHGHRFRGRVYAEFGDPFSVPFELILQYRSGGANKITACNSLLDIIRDQLKTVTVSAPSWRQLQVLWAVRRLYQPTGMRLPPKLVVVLIRRFAEGYELVKDRDDVKKVVAEVEEYNQMLKDYGLRDHQVNITQQSRLTAFGKLIFRAILLLCLALLAIPGSLLNFPIVLITRIISRKKANEALKASTVKVAARDVVGSWKVLTALAIVPLILCTYPLIIATFCKYYFGWSWLTVWGNFVIMQPMMMWSAVLLVENFMFIFKSLSPLWLAVFPPSSLSPSQLEQTLENNNSATLSAKQRQRINTNPNGTESLPHIARLRLTRARLRYKIRALVDVLGPLIYGPAFNQLRLFPFSTNAQNNIVPTTTLPIGNDSVTSPLSPIAPQKFDSNVMDISHSYQISTTSDIKTKNADNIPLLIPQSQDIDDKNTDDDDDDDTQYLNKGSGDDADGKDDLTSLRKRGHISPSSVIVPTITTSPTSSNTIQHDKNDDTTKPSPVQPLFNSNTFCPPTIPFDNSFLSPNSMDTGSDDSSSVSNEFIIKDNGDYEYNHNSKWKELQLPQSTIEMLYNTPLQPTLQLPLSTVDNNDNNTTTTTNDNTQTAPPTPSSSSHQPTPITSPQASPQQQQQHPTTTPSPSTQPHGLHTSFMGPSDDEENHSDQEMVMMDGLTISQAQKDILCSQALQPLTDEID